MRLSNLSTVLVLLPALALAQVPAKVAYQGRLLNADGTAAAGPLNITFSIHAVSAGGAGPLWVEEQTLGLTDGYYSVYLGELKPLPASVFDGSERYLELSVGGSVMNPRQRMATVPYALVAQSVSGGSVNASSLAVASKVVVDSSGNLSSAAIAASSISRDRLERDGLTTDVARGALVKVTGGDLLGGGPTNEYATESYWSTSTFPATMTVDLGGLYHHVAQVTFESAWRTDTRFIPSYSGAAAYVLEHSTDATTWTSIPAVAPVQGDVFIHSLPVPTVRYLRLKIISPATAGNPVNISMFRVFSKTYGDSTRVDARRLYGANGSTAGRVTGTVGVACDAGSTTTATCSRWGTGRCEGGGTAVCTSQIGCSAGVLVEISHGVCSAAAHGIDSYCHHYLCIE